MSYLALISANFGIFDNDPVYTVREVANDILECDVGHVYDLISERKLKAINVGVGKKPNYRIRASAIRAFFAAGEVETAKRAEPSTPILDAVVARRGRPRTTSEILTTNVPEHHETRLEMVRRLKRGR